MSLETSKQRVARITDHKYFERPDKITAVKHVLSMVLLVVTILVLLWAVAINVSGWGASVISPGPVASVHAVWNDRCDACHKPFHGIHTIDRCTTCHGGPVHFKAQPSDTHRCTDCHSEHQGPAAMLARPADAACVRCHGDLGTQGFGHTDFQEKITDFTRDHPVESRSVRRFNPDKDRALKFSHAVHMSPGMTLDRNNPRPFLLRAIKDEAERRRYRELQGASDDDAVVQLDCTACHRLDAGEFGLPDSALTGLPRSPLLPSRAAGENPLPITYEIQCKACHPLDEFDGEDRSHAAPHRLQPEELHTFLRGFYVHKLFDTQALPLDRIDVGSDGRLDRAPMLRKAGEVLEEAIGSAERTLETKCCKCHFFDDVKTPFPKPHVRPLRARDAWYQHARFTHIAHRAVDCRVCHPGAYPSPSDVEKELNELEPVLVPEVDKCLACHGPVGKATGNVTGGAQSDCVECHYYHYGTTPLHGMGAAARDPALRLYLEAFQRGEPATPVEKQETGNHGKAGGSRDAGSGEAAPSP
jgi:predicted CXXCH cytochrome family protein